MISINNLNMTFHQPLFKNASLKLYRNKVNVLLGKSGSGKTTLLNELGLLNKKNHCLYEFDGIDIKNIKKENYRANKIGYVFQENELFHQLTVKENLEFACMLAGLEGDIQKIEHLLIKTKTIHLKDKKIYELSGGEQQRIAICFALAKEPDLLLLDEPTSFLDYENAMSIIELLELIAGEGNIIVFIATHDQRIINDQQILYTIEDYQIKCQSSIIEKENLVKRKERHQSIFQKAIHNYIRRSSQNTHKLLYISLSIVLVFLFFSISYSQYYQNYILNNVINSPLEEMRVYYGKNEKKCIESIERTLTNNTIKKINQIEGIEELIPFYEIIAEHNGNSLAIQTYDDSLKTGIYVSYSLKDDLQNNTLTFSYENQEYNLNITGYLDKNHFNQYSHTSENIIYIPYQQMIQIFKDTKLEAQLYILKLNNHIDLTQLEDKIMQIDPQLTLYSSLDLNTLHLMNTQLIDGVQQMTSVLMILIFIFIIYDKYKYISSREKEFGLLFANGLQLKDIIKILIFESLFYILISISIAVIINTIICQLIYKIYFFTPIFIMAMIILILMITIPTIISFIVLKKRSIIGLINDI